MQRPDAPASCSRWPRQGGSPVGALGRNAASADGSLTTITSVQLDDCVRHAVRTQLWYDAVQAPTPPEIS
ncbi:MAG: hypothetical protein WBV74_07345, partial [Pseudonocardiaceae bacterium]